MKFKGLPCPTQPITVFNVSPISDIVVIIAGKRYDEKVDIFSFGIVLCEVRTGNYSQMCEQDLPYLFSKPVSVIPLTAEPFYIRSINKFVFL